MLKKIATGILTLLIAALPLAGVAKADTVTNLISNPSAETSTDGVTADGWVYGSWGQNTSTSSYVTTAHTGTHALRVDTTAYTAGTDTTGTALGGAVNWYYAGVPVTAGTTYAYSNWYQSNVDTEVDAQVVVNGVTQYYYLGTVLANTNWTQFKTTFTAPAGATSMAIYQLLAKVGYIVSDDYSLTTYTATPFNRAMVSVTFDDGWENQYATANQQAMTSNGLIGTYYIISGSSVTTPDPLYMTGAQIKALYAAGNEIASHTVTHPDLTTLTPAQLTTEMQTSQTTLQTLLGANVVTDFAYPFGAYNGATIAEGQKYYASQRTVNAGFNTKDNLDVTQLKMYEVESNITQAQVQGWINDAITQHAWLILCYHEIATTPADPTDALYTTQPADFAAEMSYLKGTGVAVETVAQALAEAKAQIGTTPPAVKPGDVNGDGLINIKDATLVSLNWGKTGATAAQGDLNGDGLVNIKDATLVSLNWGK